MKVIFAVLASSGFGLATFFITNSKPGAYFVAFGVYFFCWFLDEATEK